MNSPRTTKAALIIEETGQVFLLTQEIVTIGRKAGNTIVLPDDLKTSRYHAAISSETGRYVIQDAGSSNGTYLNGQRISAPEPLNDGDLIKIGDTTFTVKFALDETEPALFRPASGAGDETMVKGSLADADVTRPPAPVPAALQNPYVGPRTFTQEEGDRFFGREHEARELVSLIIAQRLVLFYAQSGAGKSSLLNARVIPRLREAGFPVLPTGRVSGELPEGIRDVDNIYTFNLMLSLDESDGDPKRFTHMKLTNFLERLTSFDGRHYYYDDDAPEDDETHEFHEEMPYILIIDQFEEIVSTHPSRWQDREEFFQQLDQAMTADPFLWVVLTLREDYVATLDPYMPLVAGKMRARFYMQRMGYEAALEAIKRPAEKFGRPFASGVAESLADNLRQIRVQGTQASDQPHMQLGQYVEPVQLQVVCYQLWENLQDRPPGEITQEDLEQLGNVDEALAQFYEQALADVVRRTEVSEIDLRNWFETQLITEVGTRGTVYRGKTETGGIANRTVDLLVNKFMIRSEARTGGTWYELVHDRFVPPILQANQKWRLTQPLIQMAQAWADAGKGIEKLIEGQQLQQALESNWQGLGPLVEEFLEASRAAQEVKEKAVRAEKEEQRQRELQQAQALAEEQRKRAEDQARSTRRLRWLSAVLGIVFLVAVGVAIAAANQRQLAQAEADARATAQQQAIVERADALTAKQTAESEANSRATAESDAILAQQTAEAQREAADANAAEAQALNNQLSTQVASSLSSGSTAEAEADATAIALETQAAALEATKSAEATLAAIPTPTSTLAPPTETPTPAIYTPAAPEPTETSTPTATAAPNRTATAEAIETELANVRATQTGVAERAVLQVASDESGTGCPIQVQGEFERYWDNYRDRLGCPLQAESNGGAFAEQPFEHGFMFWSQILDIFIVTMHDGDRENQGRWRMIKPSDIGGSIPLDSSTTPCQLDMPPPEEGRQYSPIRGFGGVWCRYEDIRHTIGYGTQPEYGVSEDRVQRFTNGYILKASNGAIYVMYGGENSGSYDRLNGR